MRRTILNGPKYFFESLWNGLRWTECWRYARSRSQTHWPGSKVTSLLWKKRWWRAAVEGLEGRHPYGWMVCSVEPVLCNMEKTKPSSRVFPSETAQLKQLLPKTAHKNGVSVWNYGFRGAMKPKYFHRKSSSQIRSSIMVRKTYEVHRFREPITNHPDCWMAEWGWKMCDEVHVMQFATNCFVSEYMPCQ